MVQSTLKKTGKDIQIYVWHAESSICFRCIYSNRPPHWLLIPPQWDSSYLLNDSSVPPHYRLEDYRYKVLPTELGKVILDFPAIFSNDKVNVELLIFKPFVEMSWSTGCDVRGVDTSCAFYPTHVALNENRNAVFIWSIEMYLYFCSANKRLIYATLYEAVTLCDCITKHKHNYEDIRTRPNESTSH